MRTLHLTFSSWKYLPLLFLLGGISSALTAQPLTQTLRGTVLDADTKAPIAGATVMIPKRNIGTYSNEEGEFRLENVPLGRHELRVYFLGYETRTLPNILLTSAKEMVLNLELTESVVQMEAVEITAKEDKVAPVNELSVVSTRAFSVEETKRFAGSFNDPSRMAASYAGVSSGEFDEDNEIVIRGNSPRGLLWRLEGIEIPSPNHFTDQGASSGSVSIISSNMLSNSDFSTGAFPSEYGNALSGVFDIYMRKGNNEQREYAFEAGLIGFDFSAEGPFKKGYGGSYLVNYRFSTLSMLSALGLDIVEGSQIDFQDLSFKLHLPTKNAGNFSIFGIGGLSQSDEESEGFFPDGSVGITEKEYFNSNMGLIGTRHRILLGEKTVLTSSLAATAQEVTFEDNELNEAGEFYLDDEDKFVNYTVKAQSILSHKLNAKHLIKTGILYSRLSYDLTSKSFIDEEQRNITFIEEQGGANVWQAFAHWRYRLNEVLTLNSGVHLTYFDLTQKSRIEPRASLKWQLGPTNYLSAGVGMHSRRETLATYLAKRTDDEGAIYQPNQDLDFTKAVHYVLGYDHLITPDLHARLEVYYQDLYDVPISNRVENPFSTINQVAGFTNEELINEGTGRNYGLELTLEKFFSRNYFFLLTSSWYQSKFTALDGIERDSRFNGNFINNFLFGKEFAIRKDNRILVSVRTVMSGGKRFTPVDLAASRDAGYTIYDWNKLYTSRTPTYWRSDFSMSYVINRPKVTHYIKIDIQNVLNRSSVLDEFYSPTQDAILQDTQGSLIPVVSYKIQF